MRNWGATIATLGGIGRLRPAPGTWGSAVGLAAAVPIVWAGGWFALVLALGAVVAVGTWAADAHEQASGSHDASEVVIDEVAGQWVALLPAVHMAGAPWWSWLLAFVLFRAFDIWKPGPIGTLDRSFEGGFGTMVDDLAAGFAAAILLTFMLAVIV